MTRFRQEFRQAARDAAKHGLVEVRERGKVIGFLVKPSLHRALAASSSAEKWQGVMKEVWQAVKSAGGKSKNPVLQERARRRH